MFTTAFVFVALYALALTILHFSNPYPLIQIPDNGHRLYLVPSEHHDTIVNALATAGLWPFGTFTAGGIRQTLMQDGITVIASGAGMRGGGISLISKNPTQATVRLRMFLGNRGVETGMIKPTDLDGKLVIATLPSEFGLSGIAFHLPGPQMPWPQWEK